MVTYRPPVASEGWTHQKPFCYYNADKGISVIKRDGEWATTRVLDHYEIDDLTEGVDYFVGGYVYDIDSTLFAELAAAGLT